MIMIRKKPTCTNARNDDKKGKPTYAEILSRNLGNDGQREVEKEGE